MLTERQQEHHNASFEHYGDWVQFCDPFTGERFEPGRVPGSIEHLSGFGPGIDYLRQRSDVVVSIFGEKHGDNDVTSPAEINAQLAKSDAVFLEGYGTSKEVEDLFWAVCTNYEGISVSQSTVNALGAYKMRQLKHLAGCKKPIFFPEMSIEGNGYEKDLIDFTAILEELRPLAMSDENFALALEINLAASTIMREWFMIAKMGMKMKLYEHVTGHRLRQPMIWIGKLHAQTMPPKLAGLGLTVNAYVAREQHDGTPARAAVGEFRRSNGTIPFVEAARDGLARIIS